MNNFASVHHVFNFDLRHFAQGPEQWWAINSSNWPIGAALRSRHADVTSFHVIGERDAAIGPLRVHRATFSGPGVGKYGSDISWSLLKTLRNLGPHDAVFLHEAGWPAGQLLAEVCLHASLVGVYHGNGSGGSLARVDRLGLHMVLRPEVGYELRDLGVPSNRIVELTPTVSEQFIHHQISHDPIHDTRVGFVGRPYAPKGIDDVVQAVNALAATGSPVALELVGTALPDDAEAVARIRASLRRLGAEVRVLGRVSNSELPSIMSQWSLLAFPSHSEGCPRSVLEAAAVGIPTVGVQGVIPDKIVDGKAVIAVPRHAFVRAVVESCMRPKASANPPFVQGHDWGGQELDRVLTYLPSAPDDARLDPGRLSSALRDCIATSRLARRVSKRIQGLRRSGPTR